MNPKRFQEIRKTLKKRKSDSTSCIGTLGLTLFLFSLGLSGGLAGSLLISVAIFRSFSLFHDSVHKSCSQNSLINNLVGFISASLCFLPFDQWKQIHLKHHLWTGNISEDPSMGLIKNYEALPEWLRAGMDASWKYYVPLLASLQQGVFWLNSIKQAKSSKGLSAFASILVPVITWGWLISMKPLECTIGIIFYLVAVEIVNFPHHLGMASSQTEKSPAWEQEKFTRSCSYPSWISRYIVLNFNYHIEHHFYPELPWWKLPEARQLLEADLPKECFTEEHFSWTLSERKRRFQDLIRETYPNDSVQKAS